jgi:hypothetical protein
VRADHLSEDEVARVLELVHEGDAIVVGGQCLAIWSRHYATTNRAIAQTYSMTSLDVDFYASPEAAKAFAARLDNSTIYIPKIDDHTPNAAVVVGMLGDRKITVDFMHSINGVDRKSIENNYITLTGSRTDTGTRIDILLLHPLDCLRSRLSNINDLKRHDPHSLSSAKAAILVLDAFINDLLDLGWVKQAQSTLLKLYFVTRNNCLGQTANLEFGIDPTPILEKYVHDSRLDERWRSFQLSSSIRRLNEKAAKVQTRIS